MLDTEHPFAVRRIHTDGRNIFMEAQRETGNLALYDLVADNFAIYDVLVGSFIASIEYQGEEPRRWTPDSQFPRIIVDPHRAFGRPIEVRSGAPAEALFDAWRGEQGDTAKVAAGYGTDPEGVEQAVCFVLGIRPTQQRDQRTDRP